MSSIKGLSQGIREIVIFGSVLLWIGCERGVEVAPPTQTTPPAATGEAAVAQASEIPNITSSIFQNQSFECLNEVYNTSQNAKQSVIFQKDFEKCRFLAVVAEEFLGGKSTNRGHVFSKEALENPASDTFGEYRNEVINPNTSANNDLSASQRAQSELSGRCSATEEIKVKKIEPTPGALRIVPPGCKDDAGNQLEYAFSLVFCCPKPVSTPSPTPSDGGGAAPSPTPVINSTSPISFTCRKATNRFQDSTLAFPDDIDFFGFDRPGSFNQDLIERAEGSQAGEKLVIKAITSILTPSSVGVSFDDRQDISKVSTVGGDSSFVFLDDGTSLSNNGMITKSPGGATLLVKMELISPLLDGFEIRIPKKVLDEIPFRHLIVFANKTFLGKLQTIAIFCVLDPVLPQ